MRSFRFALLAALVACVPMQARAALHISFDTGGSIGEYVEKYTMLRQAEAKVIIDGPCISACTLITTFLTPQQVCVTPSARLVFHSGKKPDGEHSVEGTRLIWSMYPENVRSILLKRGWNGDSPQNEHADLIYVEGDELRSIYPACGVSSASTLAP